MQTDRFPKNSRSKFKSYIDINHLKNIPDQNIEVAVKSIMYENSVSFKKFYMKPLDPDVVVLKRFPSEEFSISKNIKYKADMRVVPMSSSEINKPTNFEDYVFDLRKKDNEIGYDKMVFKGAHEKFSSINIITEDREHVTYLIQMIFLVDQIVKSNLELSELLEYIYNNRIFTKDVNPKKFSDDIIVLFGEQLSHTMKIKEGNPIKRYESLFNLFDSNFKDQFESAINKRLKDKEKIGKQLFMLLQNKSKQMYTRWNIAQLYTELNILKQDVLGLRTSIADYSIRGSKFDRITSVWNASNLKDEIVQVNFKNPLYFKTSKERLSNANFEIVDFTTEEQPYFGIGSPTYIHCLVRGIETSNMKQPFNVLLDSNCIESKKLFPQNTATDFKIKLAERIIFNRNWKVSLQSLFLSNKLFNISGEMFNFKCEEKIKLDDYDKVKKHYNLQKGDEFPEWEQCTIKDSTVLTCKKGVEITSGCYSTVEELIDVIQADWEKNNFNLSIKVVDQRIRIENKDNQLFDITLEISPYLSFAMGFTEELDLNSSSIFRIKDSITSTYEAKLSVFTPKYLIICCDIVDDTIFSGEHVKLLRMVVNNTAENEKIIAFEFLHHDFVPLCVKEFSTIHITITDVAGNPILTNSVSPTYLQLVFANV